MVSRSARAALGAAVLIALGGVGCTVKQTEADILYEVHACATDADCVGGWSCRYFAMDPDQRTYCVQDCAADGDCDFGDRCSTEGFCVEPCDVQQPSCRGPGFDCLRRNMMVGADTGYCQPADTCATFTDCGNVFDWCIADSLGGVAPDLEFAEGDNLCVESCVGGADCTEGFVCLKKQLKEHTGINVEAVPEICVPKCGADNACPIGYRCLTDALPELNPDLPPDLPQLNFCVPGLPGVRLPCGSDDHCLSGLCVVDPEPVRHPAGDRYLPFCAEPCDGQGDCPSARFECLPSDHDGQAGQFCFTRELLSSCEGPEDCEIPEQCMDWSNVDPDDSLQLCTVPCSGPRDPSCGTGLTCLPTAVPGQHGCFIGYPGFPCDNANQCLQVYGEPVQCIGTSGQQSDGDRICTKLCTHANQCTFGEEYAVSSAPLCHQGICQPIGFNCNDPLQPFECNASMDCIEVYPSRYSCTIDCDGLRTSNHDCPGQFTCGPVLDHSGTALDYYCYVGWPGLMPCREDSECLDLRLDGSQRCFSPSGAGPEVDGLCSMPCSTDADCAVLQGTTVGQLLCLPGVPDPGGGVVGYCVSNPTYEVILGISDGQQGTFCETLDGVCADGHGCVDASGTTVSALHDYGRKFCAKRCGTVSECSQSPTAHRCYDANGAGNGHCIPDREAPYSRGFWAECFDHRQCADGVCFQRDLSAGVPGNCTRTCGVGDPCTGYGEPGSADNSTTCQQGVCQPAGTVVPGN